MNINILGYEIKELKKMDMSLLDHLQWAQQIAIFSYFVESSKNLGLQSARYPARHFASSPSPSTNVASVFSLTRSPKCLANVFIQWIQRHQQQNVGSRKVFFHHILRRVFGFSEGIFCPSSSRKIRREKVSIEWC